MAQRKCSAPAEKKIRLSLSSGDIFFAYLALRSLRRKYRLTLADSARYPVSFRELYRGQIERDLEHATAAAQTFADALGVVFDPEAAI